MLRQEFAPQVPHRGTTPSRRQHSSLSAHDSLVMQSKAEQGECRQSPVPPSTSQKTPIGHCGAARSWQGGWQWMNAMPRFGSKSQTQSPSQTSCSPWSLQTFGAGTPSCVGAGESGSGPGAGVCEPSPVAGSVGCGDRLNGSATTPSHRCGPSGGPMSADGSRGGSEGSRQAAGARAAAKAARTRRLGLVGFGMEAPLGAQQVQRGCLCARRRQGSAVSPMPQTPASSRRRPRPPRWRPGRPALPRPRPGPGDARPRPSAPRWGVLSPCP